MNKGKEWLDHHKVYFETVAWSALTVMSLVLMGTSALLSCQANSNGRKQNEILEKQAGLIGVQAEQVKQQVKLLESQVDINRVSISPSFSFSVDYGLDGAFSRGFGHPSPALLVTNNGGKIFEEAGTVVLYWELTTKSGVTKRVPVKGIFEHGTGFVLGSKMLFGYNDLHNRYNSEPIPFDWWKAKWGRFRNYAYLAITYTDVLGKPRKEQYILDAISWSSPKMVDAPPTLSNDEIDLSPFRSKSEGTFEEDSQRAHDAALFFKTAIDALDK